MIYLVMDGSYDRCVLYATLNENDAHIFIRNFIRKFPDKYDKPFIEVYEETTLKVMLDSIENADHGYEVRSNWVKDIEEETV